MAMTSLQRRNPSRLHRKALLRKTRRESRDRVTFDSQQSNEHDDGGEGSRTSLLHSEGEDGASTSLWSKAVLTACLKDLTHLGERYAAHSASRQSEEVNLRRAQVRRLTLCKR